MLTEIAAVREAGLAGVVIGASLPDGRLDRDCLSGTCRGVTGPGCHLHRAIDLVPDVAEVMAPSPRLASNGC